MAQINFTEYITVERPPINVRQSQSNPFQMESMSQRRTTNQHATPKQSFPVVGGYYVNNGNLKRIKIKVNSVSNLGQPSVYLRGVYDASYNMWNDCNTQAYRVEESLDGEYLANNFEWKASSLSYGTIYFNY